MRTATATVLLATLVAALAATACNTNGSGDTGDEQDVTSDGDQPTDIFGNDRVGAALRGKGDLVPGDFGAFEQLFKVGRACPNAAKEIFVVQEAQSRASGMEKGTSVILPRAVITGCAVTPGTSDPRSPSYSLMSALISGDTGSTDNMDLTHVEAVALDQTTGEFNWYAFDSNGKGKPGTLTRTERNAAGKTTARRWTPGGTTKSITPPLDCFGCHVNGGPLMNESHDPWTNWVSQRAPLPAQLTMTGDTRDIVTKAETASELEQIILAANSFIVEGGDTSGFGPRTVKGSDPGSVATLMKSVFCQTELSYKSGHAAVGVPLELFVDPDAAPNAFVLPAADPSDIFPFLLPVRSPHDSEVEIFLQIQGYLTPTTVRAIRLLDDQNDIFSDARCGALKDATASLPTAPADVDKKVRSVLAQKVSAGTFKMTDPQKALVAKLLTVADGDASLQPLEDAYLTDITARFGTASGQLKTPSGVKILKAREQARKDAASKMFDGGGPLPILTPH